MKESGIAERRQLIDTYVECLQNASANDDESWRTTPIHDLLDDICEKMGVCPGDRQLAYHCLDMALLEVKSK